MFSKKIIILITLLVSILNAKSNYVLYDDGLLDKRAYDKIKQIGDEVKAKIGVNLYVDIKADNGINIKDDRKSRIEQMREKEALLTKDLKPPFVVLTMAVEQRYAGILTSPDLKDIIDKDDILGGYVIPLLASKDKNTLFAKCSAASLNGFAQIGDSLASHQNIELVSSIGSEGKTAGTIWRVFMYTLVVIGIVLYTVIILREKKYKKINEEKEKNNERK
ncbi:MAG: hypothetical protein U9Q30_02105 [Campylobacterota bacterium]|nr:hypothetical protein [Campylobacterota bacterium]